MKTTHLLLTALVLAGLPGAARANTLIPVPPPPGLAAMPNMQFGQSVAVSPDYTVIGAAQTPGGQHSGLVQVFHTATGAKHLEILHPGDDFYGRFGAVVAVSGTKVVVGAPNAFTTAGNGAGRVYVFDLAGATPQVPVLTLSAPNAQQAWSGDVGGQFGAALALDGNRLVVGAWGINGGGGSDQGQAYVYQLDGGTPSQPVLTLNPPAPAAGLHYGRAVAVSGNRVVVSAPNNALAGQVHVHDLGGAAPATPVLTLDTPGLGNFGTCLALEGARLVASATAGAGAAYVFDLAGGTPATPTATLGLPDGQSGDSFGTAAALSGNRVVIGAPGRTAGGHGGAGSAYVFDLAGAVPGTPVETLTSLSPAAGDGFGRAVGIVGSRVVAGEPQDDGVAQDFGRAFLFDMAGPTPAVPVETLLIFVPNAYGQFGYSVAVSGNLMVVGMPEDDSEAFNAGRAYVYDLGGPQPDSPIVVLTNPNPLNTETPDSPGQGKFGAAVAIAGNIVVVGAPRAGPGHWGLAYVFNIAGANPATHIAKLVTGSAYLNFGADVATDGTLCAVGKTGGDAFVFEVNGTLKAHLPNDQAHITFNEHARVAIQGSTVFVGRPLNSISSTDDGGVYVYNVAGAVGGLPLNPHYVIPNPGGAAVPPDRKGFGGVRHTTDRRSTRRALFGAHSIRKSCLCF